MTIQLGFQFCSFFRSAFFRTSDICTNKEFMVALNRTFGHGGLLCNFRPQEIFLIVSSLQHDLRKEDNYRKTALTIGGLQKDTEFFLLNRDQIFNKVTGQMVCFKNFDQPVWIHSFDYLAMYFHETLLN